jgi:hypothetical protein
MLIDAPVGTLLTESSPREGVVPDDASVSEQPIVAEVKMLDEIAGFAIEDAAEEGAAFADAVPTSSRQMRNTIT